MPLLKSGKNRLHLDRSSEHKPRNPLFKMGAKLVTQQIAINWFATNDLLEHVFGFYRPQH